MFFKIRAALKRRQAERRRQELQKAHNPWPDHFDHICVVGMPRTGSTFIQTALGRDAALMTYGENSPSSILKEEKTTTGLKTIIPDVKAAKQYIHEVKELAQQRKVLCVICRRENLLHQYISLQRALLTNQWHSMEKNEITEIKTHHIDEKEFYWFLKNAYSIENELLQLLTITPSIEIQFEKNHTQVLNLLKKLNKPILDLTTLSTQKLQYDPRTWASNYSGLLNMYNKTLY